MRGYSIIERCVACAQPVTVESHKNLSPLMLNFRVMITIRTISTISKVRGNGNFKHNINGNFWLEMCWPCKKRRNNKYVARIVTIDEEPLSGYLKIVLTDWKQQCNRYNSRLTYPCIRSSKSNSSLRCPS